MHTTLVIGAHGKVGQLLVRDLAQAGHHVLAGFRHESQFESVAKLDNVTPVVFDLQALPTDMADFYQEHDLDEIVFTAGAGGASDALTTQIDLDGAIKSMDAAQVSGVKRYIMISAAGADDRNRWVRSGIYTYFMMKHYADRFLKASDLDYTIVRPTTLTNEAGAGKIETTFNLDQSGLAIPRADVASFVTAIIDQPQTQRQVYEISAGNQPINQAF
ncbi:SDR family oxidoreductase [Convivina praedatoris]|uniref:Sugar epimerase YhfK n=1 Tax=Convivina praedatoris TaxID=2880963 RepID=A0ABN8HCH0_9LACO|nr:SDR family oxidoreductase [Convivina sp. LMG 32447]CAH1851821.1 putative sugar epimerase YhfK [Convivina sp. LMG 32447]CAH1853904.1 putative sugar epimerase YhfK [Convivina sp. LMG 32447]CAH1854165.1 putative sugar epimerase YhfK [Convivina sp. LMG 32447]